MCRLFKLNGESVEHILIACDRHKFCLYKARHDKAMLPVVSALCLQAGLPVLKVRKRPPAVLENNKVNILWDPVIVTTVNMTARRPDMIVFVKDTKTIVVVERTCCWGARMEAFIEKWRKYHPLMADLKIQFPTWKVK